MHKSVSLVEPEDASEPYVQIDSYVELKGGDGDIDFVTLTCERQPYEGKTSSIKGLEPIIWRQS